MAVIEGTVRTSRRAPVVPAPRPVAPKPRSQREEKYGAAPAIPAAFNPPAIPSPAATRTETVTGPTILDRIRQDLSGLVTGSPLSGPQTISPAAVGELAPNLQPSFIRGIYNEGARFRYDRSLGTLPPGSRQFQQGALGTQYGAPQVGAIGGETRGLNILINPNQDRGAFEGVFAHEGAHYLQDRFVGGIVGGRLLNPRQRVSIGSDTIKAVGAVGGVLGARPGNRFAAAVEGGKKATEFFPHLAGGGYQDMFGNILGAGNTGYQRLENVPALLRPFFKGLLR